MPGGVWGQAANTQGQGGLSGGAHVGAAPTFDPTNVYARSGGSPVYYGPGANAVQTRQFKNVGKANLNLLDPLATSRADSIVPIDAPPKSTGPLGGVEDYYSPSTPGGIFAGIAGAIGQTVGGIFGQEGAQAGAQAGQVLGKTLELPMSIVGGVGWGGIPFIAPIIDKANSTIEENSPYILRDTLKVPTNFGGAFQSLLNGMGVLGRAVERTYAGMTGQRGALPEDIQARIDSGELTHDEALDELVMGGRGFTNDPWHNMVFSLLTDPANYVTLGVGAVAGAAKGTSTVARAFAAGARAIGTANESLAFTRVMGQAGELGDIARAAHAGEDISKLGFSRDALSGMRRTINEDMATRAGGDVPHKLKLSIVERAGMSALGPVRDSATENIVYRVANGIAAATDPSKYFSGAKSALRSMELLHTASSTGAVASLKPQVVRRLTAVADDIVGDGGDRIMEALSTWAANAEQEVVAGEMASDAMRTGAIPKLPSSSVSESIRDFLKGGAYDTNLGKYVELHIERTKDIRVAGLSQAARDEATHLKMARILGADPTAVAAKMGKVSVDEAIAVHGFYYYTKGKALHTTVMNAIGEAASKGTLPAHIDPHDITMVTPRTLTDLRAKRIDAAVKAGNVGALRAEIENWDAFNWVTEQSVKDADLVDAIKGWMDSTTDGEGRSFLPREVALRDANGNFIPGLPQELEDWMADSDTFGYGLANGLPPDAPLEAQWRASYTANGTIRNASPWLQFVADGIPAAKRVGRFESMRMQMFRGIRGDRIWWNQRRRFITDMASDEAGTMRIPPELSDRLFRSLMGEAQAGHLLPRGMAPEMMYDVVNKVLADARAHNGAWQNLAGDMTERQVVTSFLRAMEGDVSLVGATQKLTGSIKARAPGAGMNFWGQLSEKLYPLMRFTLNPVFMTMEAVEPYILGYMRGVPVPFRHNSPGWQQGLASYNAITQFVKVTEDGMTENMEMFALRVNQASEAKAKFGPRTFWGRIRGTHVDIATRKNVAAALQARQLIGDNLYLAFRAIKRDADGGYKTFDQFWGDLEYHYGTSNKAEIAERWIASHLALADHDGRPVGLLMDLANPVNVGRRIRLTTASRETARQGDYTFADVENLLDSVEMQKSGPAYPLFKGGGKNPGDGLLEWLRTHSEDEWAQRVEEAGLTPRFERVSQSSASDVWRLANGPQVKPPPGSKAIPFWKGYRDTYLKGIVGATPGATRKLRDAQVRAARAFVQAAAMGKGIGEDEFIALHFADVPKWLANYAEDPNGVQRVLTDIRADFGYTLLRRAQGGAEPAQVTFVKWAAQAKALEEPAYAPQVALMRAGNETRDFVYLPLSRYHLDRMTNAARTGFGDTLVSTKYSAVHSDPIRALTQRNANVETLVRIKQSKVGATREFPQTNLKRQKSHDFTLDNDLYAEHGIEVYTEKGWVPWDQYVKTGEPIPGVHLRDEAHETWLRDLFEPDLGAPDATNSYGIDFRGVATSEQKNATNTYEGSGHGPINRYLRGTFDPNVYSYSSSYSEENIQKMVDHIDALIQRGSFRERKELYRGTSVRREYASELDKQVGETIRDPGFVSTTDQPSTAADFIDFGEASYQPGSRKFLITYDLPPGFHMNLIEGHEGEHLLGRGIEFKVVKRGEITHMDGTRVTTLTVTPINPETLPRINRDMLGQPQLHRRNEELARHLAVTDPAGLRARAAAAPENVRQGLQDVVEQYIRDAEAAVPQNVTSIGGRRFGPLSPQDTLDAMLEHVPEDDIPAYHGTWADIRGRFEELMSTEGIDGFGEATAGEVYNSNAGRALVAVGSALAEKGGSQALTLFLSTLERLWHSGPVDAAQAARDIQLANFQTQQLLRGLKNPLTGTPDISARIDDSIDTMLGNESRRAIGRTDLSQPIVADDAAYEAAGYLTQETMDDLTAAGHTVPGVAPKPPVTAPIGLTENVTPVRSLGGSTGANLVEDSAGRQYVQKRGSSEAHIMEEHYADDVYTAMGVPVPKQELLDIGGAVKRADYIDGGQTLEEFKRTASPEELQRIYDQLGENFALDALLANWDVVGPDFANIVIRDGIAYRIDNGGALRFRAMGEPKGAAFGNGVSELERMRKSGNAGAMAAFGRLTDGEVSRQVAALAARRETILAALPPELREVIDARLDNMVIAMQGIEPAAARQAPGVVADAITDESHAHLVAHYNEVARLANERGLGGFRDWQASDIAVLAGRSREEQGRVVNRGLDEAIADQTRLVPAEVYYPLGSTNEHLNPLLDLLNKPENRSARHLFITGVQTILQQKLRDEFGIIVTGSDDRGIGIWGALDPQPLVPLQLLASGLRGDEMADVLSYVMEQKEVWHFTPATEAVDDIADFSAYDPRVTIRLPAGPDSERVATELGRKLPFAKGMTAMQEPGGGWLLTIIDREGHLTRAADGSVNDAVLRSQIEETGNAIGENQLDSEFWVDYGKTYIAGPDTLPNGMPDWGGHRDATLRKLQERGTPSDGTVLDGVRTTYNRTVVEHLRDIAPDNFDRTRRGEAITSTLEDRRGGSVFGTTTPVGASAALVRGYGAADALTGIHELVHVFSIAGLDPSVRDAVGREWSQRVTHIEGRIAQLEQVVATSPNRSVVTRAKNEMNALQADIHSPANGTWSKAQEEFFAHVVIDWIDRGVTTNPDLKNALGHFRNWLQLQQKQRAANGLPPIQASPAMSARLDKMFSRPGVETVSHSVEGEVLNQAARQVIRSSWDEAHTTQFYKKDRSMMERSINHPYIGLYPASYMWGKVLPEMVRFLALRPFGMTTPFLAWNVVREVGDTVRSQSQQDPSFKKFLADNESAFMLMSMLFPALPMDIPANASLPVRRIAEQGLENQQLAAQGLPTKDIEFGRGATDAIQYAVGPLGTIRTSMDIVGSGGDLIRGALGIQPEEDKAQREVIPLR